MRFSWGTSSPAAAANICCALRGRGGLLEPEAFAVEVLVEAPGAPVVLGCGADAEVEAAPAPETLAVNDIPATSALREISFIWNNVARATSVSG